MKIAVIRKNFDPYGGAERYLSRLTSQLVREGHEIHIFAKRWETGSEENGKVIWHRVPTIDTFSFLEVLSFARFASALVRRENFDVIHSFDRTLYQDVYRAGDGCHREWLIQRKKIEPWIKGLSHSVNPMHRSILSLEKRLFQSPRLKRIVAISQRGKEEIIRHYQVPASKIKVVYCGVDPTQFNPERSLKYRQKIRQEFALEERDRVLLFIGSGFERKGLKFIIASLPHLKENVKLVVVGKGRPAYYQKMVKKLKVRDRVLFAGPRRDAENFYGAGDLFILPSIYEPFSNACVEALACGLPVITTRITGASELIREEKNGLIIEDPRNIQEMVGTLQKALQIWERLNNRRQICNASPLPTLESNAHDMIRIYEDIFTLAQQSARQLSRA
jgi:UDP-glucose:(heptosyl)LPS alpha-1,3-glucosyltransferase